MRAPRALRAHGERALATGEAMLPGGALVAVGGVTPDPSRPDGSGRTHASRLMQSALMRHMVPD